MYVVLLYDIQNILYKYNIFTKIRPNEKSQEYNINKGLNAKLPYTMHISVSDSYKFKQIFNLTLKKKQDRIDNFKEPSAMYSRTDVIPNIETEEFGVIEIKRNNLEKYLNKFKNINDKHIFESIKNEDIYYDKIISIEDVENTNKYVYDLTVKNTLNFTTYSGVACRDTFHFAGVGEASNVNQGVPRLEELLNVGTNIKQPQLNIHLTEEYRKELETAEQVKYNLELVRIGELIKSDAIYLEPTNDLDNVLQEDKDIMKIYSIFSELDTQYQNIPNNPWIVRLEFNHREMVEKNITMDEIYTVLKENLVNSSIMFSDDNSGKLIFRMRLEFDSNKENVDDDIKLLTEKIQEIKDIPIKGLEGIDKIYRPKENHSLIVPDGDLFKTEKEYYLETSGGDLFDVLIKDYVDSTRTTSINVSEVYQVLGVEAARYAMEYQLTDVMAKSDSYTSPRNIGLLCDAMTFRGKIMPANRNGINQSDNDIGPLAKSSFEETTEQLKIASIFGSYDKINGVSSNIMVGQIPKCGTGDTKIILDEDKLTQVDHPSTSKEIFNIEEILETNEYCDDNVDIPFDINNITGDNVNLMSLNI